MDTTLFKNLLRPKISAKNLQNTKKTAEAIADVYEKATVGISSTLFGSKLISANKESLVNQIKLGLDLNDKIKKIDSSMIEPGWFIMAMGFVLYWTNANFTPMPPAPPATNPAPGPNTGTVILYPGNPKKLSEDLKEAFSGQDIEFFLNSLSEALYSHLSSITGIYVGIISGPTPTPATTPWIGLFGKPQEKFDAKIIIDSKLTLAESLENITIPNDIKSSLVLLDIDYISIDGKLHRGQILVNDKVELEVREFFKILLEEKFPINKMIPVVKYNWDDDKSMEDNNTSGFNYRVIAGSNKMSKHSNGYAIDINPKWNPVIYADGTISPRGSIRNPNQPGVLTEENRAVKYLKGKNWNWGGDYISFKDWHHFDKEINK